MKKTLIDQIDSLLPQTQCELCEYAGCRPYAEAIANQGESIDRCLPGGVRVLKELGQITNQSVDAMLPSMQQKQKMPVTAVIREEECIGCTKCITACPVDAIIGASKQMHTVLTDACNGCELCLKPCPVDCIDLLPLPVRNQEQELALSRQSRERYEAKKIRLSKQTKEARQAHLKAKLEASHQTVSARQDAIQAAMARMKAKRDQVNESSQA